MIDPSNRIEYRPGLSARTTPQGIRVITLRLGADPDRDSPEQIVEARRLYASEKDWRREMMGDWSSPAGDPFFPVFNEIGRSRYVHIASQLIAGAVFRGFDFGRRCPAMFAFQYSPRSDRVWGLREFMPDERLARGLLTHEFRDAVRFLCGQVDWKEIPDSAKRWVDIYAAKPSGAHCPPPWFPPGTKFVNLAGKEAWQGHANVTVPEEAVASNIFLARGIPLVRVNPSVAGRNRKVDRMLTLRPEKGKPESQWWPGLLLDPQCEDAIAGFEGGFCYPAATAANPVPDKPKDDGRYINILDAIGYGISAVVPDDVPKERPEPKLIGYIGREPIYHRFDSEEVGWYECKS